MFVRFYTNLPRLDEFVHFHLPAFRSAGVPETAVAMLAKDGERVPFHLLFHMTGAVETWLTRLAVT